MEWVVKLTPFILLGIILWRSTKQNSAFYYRDAVDDWKQSGGSAPKKSQVPLDDLPSNEIQNYCEAEHPVTENPDDLERRIQRDTSELMVDLRIHLEQYSRKAD